MKFEQALAFMRTGMFVTCNDETWQRNNIRIHLSATEKDPLAFWYLSDRLHAPLPWPINDHLVLEADWMVWGDNDDI